MRKEREDVGMEDVCKFLQPTTMPQINEDLVGRKLDMCCKCFLEEGVEVLRWCQGEVLFVSNGINIVKPGKFRACFKEGEEVMLKWDPIVDRNKASCTCPQRILPSKWNPQQTHSEGSWRFAVVKQTVS